MVVECCAVAEERSESEMTDGRQHMDDAGKDSQVQQRNSELLNAQYLEILKTGTFS